jgi:hypothetical protein
MIRFCPRIFSPRIFCSGTFALELLLWNQVVPNLFVLKQWGASKQKDNFIGLSATAQMFAGWRQEMVKS